MGFEFYREHTVDACPEYEAALEEYRDENGNQMMTAHISVEPGLFTPEVYKTIIKRFKLADHYNLVTYVDVGWPGQSPCPIFRPSVEDSVIYRSQGKEKK